MAFQREEIARDWATAIRGAFSRAGAGDVDVRASRIQDGGVRFRVMHQHRYDPATASEVASAIGFPPIDRTSRHATSVATDPLLLDVPGSHLQSVCASRFGPKPAPMPSRGWKNSRLVVYGLAFLVLVLFSLVVELRWPALPAFTYLWAGATSASAAAVEGVIWAIDLFRG